MTNAEPNGPSPGRASEASEDLLRNVLAQVRQGEAEGLAATEQALRTHPGDARLQFLRGSILAGQQRYVEAREAMQTAVNLAPGYMIARFQLGLLALCARDAIGAATAWGPIHLLPANAPLRLFSEGLEAMTRDEFEAAIERLRAGIAVNQENQALIRDMTMLIEAMQATAAQPSEAAAELSGTQLLLRQFGSRDRTT